ncbi:MAG: class I SAM-dependent methyltransferase [Anaerolineales bacterium]|nr:class I SAM-dependent methyltransferase [Anaerolineales bacterium]MCB8958749.1 class I SAM-dependent methyltransferase [Ardenticatenales bacterium]
MSEKESKWAEALWRVYNRPVPPVPWAEGGNLPWNDPEFSERMLREHLNEAHGAATRQTPERLAILDWLWTHMALTPEANILDVTCGPGLYSVPLAQRGCRVTGVDFAPASIRHARDLAEVEGVADRCQFIESDVRAMGSEAVPLAADSYDAALFIYGQWSVFTREESLALLRQINRALKPGGRICLELLDPSQIDRKASNWWYADEGRLWGDEPFLHMGERYWDEESRTAIERFYTIHLGSGKLDQVMLCDVAYRPEEVVAALEQTGFGNVQIQHNWSDLKLYDEGEWIVYVAEKVSE